MTSTAPQDSKPATWWTAFPAVQNTAELISRETILSNWNKDDYLIVDVRRNDYLGGAIKNSLNLPAESFYHNREELCKLCDRAGIATVIFYCGSSNGRGPRAAGWFEDYIKETNSRLQSQTLVGGIKGWANSGPEYIAHMKGYDAGYWEQFALNK